MNQAFTIKEGSWLARVAAIKLNAKSMAIVVGATIHLHNVSKNDFLKNNCWLKHELCHIKQFRQYGFLPFVFKYIMESIKNGYYCNKYEVEARKAEME